MSNYLIVDKVWPKKSLNNLKINPTKEDWELMKVVESKIKRFFKYFIMDKGEIGEVIFYSCMTSTSADVQFVREHGNLCARCGYCCLNFNPIIVEPNEVSNYGMKGLVLDEDGQKFRIKQPCVHLNESNECDIYEKRPNSCRNFPLKTQNGKIVIQKDINCVFIMRVLVAKTLRLLEECNKMKVEEV